MQNFVIVQRSSLVYLTEAVVGTRSQASLGVKSLIRGSPPEYLDRCIRLSVAGRFCESESRVPSLRSGVWYRLTEFLQMGWLTCWVW